VGYTLGFATYFYGLFSVYPFSMLAIATRSSPGRMWHVNILDVNFVVKVGGGAHGERGAEPMVGIWCRSQHRGPGAEPLVNNYFFDPKYL